MCGPSGLWLETSFGGKRLAVDQLVGSINNHRIAGGEAGEDFKFVTRSFTRLDQAHLRMMILGDENHLQLSTLYQGGLRHAQGDVFPNWHQEASELAGNEPRGARQIQLHAEGAAD